MILIGQDNMKLYRFTSDPFDGDSTTIIDGYGYGNLSDMCVKILESIPEISKIEVTIDLPMYIKFTRINEDDYDYVQDDLNFDANRERERFG